VKSYTAVVFVQFAALSLMRVATRRGKKERKETRATEKKKKKVAVEKKFL
jgi:hypothetical protein